MAVPDRHEFRQVVGLLPTGVTVVTAFADDGPAGATASAVCSLSLEPMMMLVCLDRGSRTLGAVEEAGRFGINVLGLDQRVETFESALFAIQNGGYSGAIMPQNIVVGDEAEEVARFVAKYAGQDAGD